MQIKFTYRRNKIAFQQLTKIYEDCMQAECPAAIINEGNSLRNQKMKTRVELGIFLFLLSFLPAFLSN